MRHAITAVVLPAPWVTLPPHRFSKPVGPLEHVSPDVVEATVNPIGARD